METASEVLCFLYVAGGLSVVIIITVISKGF